MIDLSVESKKLSELNADARVVFVVNKKIDEANSKLFEEYGYQGEGNFYHQESKTLFYGLEDGVSNFREAGFQTVQFFKKLKPGGDKIKSIKLEAPKDEKSAEALALGLLLGQYEFDKYKTKKTKPALERVYLAGEHDLSEECRLNSKSVHNLKSIAKALCDVRDVVNTPPQDATPLFLANWAQEIAKASPKLECKILEPKELESEKMGCLLAVARASVHEPRVIHLTYKPANPKAKVILVGKGLTYDCGGLSLKPSDYMVSMKADKGGGCAVIGAMQAISAIEPDIEVHGIVGAVENMIGGNAYKPDDVLLSREGVTVEVKNTDAEGRLVLADCLSYAQDLKPDYLIDFATLTGACVIGLGEYTSGVMGHCDCVKNKFLEASERYGELANPLHFNKHLDKLLKSEIADVCNISNSRYGGSITAGLFLARFIREENKNKWVHVDIAGPAYVEKEWDVNTYGASGYGVRSAVAFVQNLQNSKN